MTGGNPGGEIIELGKMANRSDSAQIKPGLACSTGDNVSDRGYCGHLSILTRHRAEATCDKTH